MGPVDVVGLGYQGLTVHQFCESVVAQDVSVVSDVRLTPLSRKPGLSKTALGAALRSVGVEYRHFPALGNPKWNRAGFGGTLEDLRAAQQVFLDQVLSTVEARRAVDELRELAAGVRVALMCFEADESRCHRSQILADILGADTRLAVAAAR
jgi:uncharacterized protein (DUF488 family)